MCANLIFRGRENCFYRKLNSNIDRNWFASAASIGTGFGIIAFILLKTQEQLWIWNQQIVEMILSNRLQHIPWLILIN
jgi:hypothetical protein